MKTPGYLQLPYVDNKEDNCRYKVSSDGTVVVLMSSISDFKRKIGKIVETEEGKVELQIEIESKNIFGAKFYPKAKEYSFGINKHVLKFLLQFPYSIVRINVVDRDEVYILSAFEIFNSVLGVERRMGSFERQYDRQIYVPVNKWRKVK
jgi:hypothetical protein